MTQTPDYQATEDTPLVSFDEQSGTLLIKGNSFPENTFDFYKPIILWIEEHLSRRNDAPFVLNMEVGYYNSSSAKVFINIFSMLETMSDGGKPIVVNWYYDIEDEDAAEDGKEYRMGMESISFNIIAKDYS